VTQKSSALDFSGLPARVADLERRCAALERQHREKRSALRFWPGPRDAADVALVATIALSIGSARWTCRELLAHARGDPELQHALTAADITNAVELGLLLRRCEGRTIDGRVVHRARTRRGLARWWVEVVQVVEV